ncbi:MAG TPA: hypothetical protein VLH84_03945 [Patescibacteria group bacterium]|nr:hypothetical protein [Patescibacteria group bacterium]
MIESDFSLLGSGDKKAVREILRFSDYLIDGVLADKRPNLLVRSLGRGDWFGRMPLCQEVSDQVTLAAHQMGIAASREVLAGWHFITCLSPADQPPSADDLVICRTWGQYDTSRYNGSFFGTRQELAERVPAGVRDETFAPDSVIYRQVTHTPLRPGSTAHVWLSTTQHELAAADEAFVMGTVSSIDQYPGRLWC